MSLPENLRAARENAGLSLRAAARDAGVSVGYLHRLEAGGHDPTVGKLVRLAEAYGAQPHDLLPAVPVLPVGMIPNAVRAAAELVLSAAHELDLAMAQPRPAPERRAKFDESVMAWQAAFAARDLLEAVFEEMQMTLEVEGYDGWTWRVPYHASRGIAAWLVEHAGWEKHPTRDWYRKATEPNEEES